MQISFPQSMMIRRRSGLDVRPLNLTYNQASNIIESLNDKEVYGVMVQRLQEQGAEGTPKAFKPYTPKTKGAKTKVTPRVKGIARKSVINSREAEFQAIYDRAVEAGREAAKACTPTPMVVSQHANVLDDSSDVMQSWYVPSGICGFARVEMPATSAFAKWLVQKGIALRQEKGIGINIWEYNQSYELKCAHASAMARSLSDSGITKVRVWTYVD